MSRYLTVREAAAYCTVSRNTFIRKIQPEVRALRIGRALRFSTADLDLWISRHTYAPGPAGRKGAAR